MNQQHERFFTDLDRALDAAGTVVIEVRGREVVASTVRPGEWTLSLGSEGRIGRVRRREEGRAIYFVGYTEEDPETVDWVSDDIDRIFDRLVMLA